MGNIGEKIKRIRIARNLTQQEVADRMGLKRNTVSQWESGARNISVDQLVEYAKIVQVTLDYFNDDSPERTLFQLMAQLESVFASAEIPDTDKDKAYQDIMRVYLKSKEQIAAREEKPHPSLVITDDVEEELL